MTPILPWQMHPLDRWAIVEMNHFYVHDDEEAQILVRFFREGQEFDVTGRDTPLIWEQACRRAIEIFPGDARGGRTPLCSPWEADQMRVLLAYEAAQLTESQTGRLLGLDPVSCRELRESAIEAGAAQWDIMKGRTATA